MICLRCKGKGVIYKIDWFVGVLTLGLTVLMDLSNPIRCPKCWGRGFVR